MTKPTKEQMQIVCAEACGWVGPFKTFLDEKNPISSPAILCGFSPEDKKLSLADKTYKPVPNYPEDPNAMQLARRRLPSDKLLPFIVNLLKIKLGDSQQWPGILTLDNCWALIDSTAQEQLEAFCRTVKPEMFQSENGGSNE